MKKSVQNKNRNIIYLVLNKIKFGVGKSMHEIIDILVFSEGKEQPTTNNLYGLGTAKPVLTTNKKPYDYLFHTLNF